MSATIDTRKQPDIEFFFLRAPKKFNCLRSGDLGISQAIWKRPTQPCCKEPFAESLA